MDKSFEEYFNLFNQMDGYGKLLWKVHFDTAIVKDGTYILRLNYKFFLIKLMEYCYGDIWLRNCNDIIKEMGGDSSKKISIKPVSAAISFERFDSIRFREELKTKDYCINLNGRVLYYSDNYKGKKELICLVVLDVCKLQSHKVNINNLLSNELIENSNIIKANNAAREKQKMARYRSIQTSFWQDKRIMRRINAIYAGYFNKKYNYIGHLF